MTTEARDKLVEDLEGVARHLFPETPEDIRAAGVRVATDTASDHRAPVAALANAVGLSPRHLRRVLDDGTTPQELVATLRAQVMRWWLHQGASCAEAARKTGYPDAASASNAYLRWLGRRPSDEVEGFARASGEARRNTDLNQDGRLRWKS